MQWGLLSHAVPCSRQGRGRVCSREMRCWALGHGAAVLYGQLDFARLLQHGERMGALWWGRLGEKRTTKSRCGGAAGTPCCRSPPCRLRNACFDSCHGNKFILRPVQWLAATWQGGQEPIQSCGIPRRTQGGRRDGVRFRACKMLCQLQNSGCWFLTQKG